MDKNNQVHFAFALHLTHSFDVVLKVLLRNKKVFLKNYEFIFHFLLDFQVENFRRTLHRILVDHCALIITVLLIQLLFLIGWLHSMSMINQVDVFFCYETRISTQ